MFNYSKLKGLIKEKFGTQGRFAREMGLSNPVVSLKLNNKSEWSQNEIERARCLLGMERSMIPTYFFTESVKDA